MKSSYLLMIFWMISSKPEPDKSIPTGSFNRSDEKKVHGYKVIEDWNLRKEKNGIKVYTRWIQTSQHATTRQVKGVVSLPVRREQITNLFTVEELAGKWMIFLDELHYYKATENPAEWYAYGRINVLGRIACFDVVTSNRVWSNEQEKHTVITMDGISDYLPKKAGIHRINNLYTTWNLISVTPGKTNIEYMFYSDMEPVVPVWMTDPVVTALLISTLCQLREKTLEYALSTTK